MKEYSRTKNSALNIGTGFASRVLVTLLSFVSRTVFIEVLGVSYLGINGLFSDILSMLSLTQLGIGTAIIYRLYKPVAEHDEGRIRILLKFYKQAYIIIGLTILTLGLLLIPALPFLIKDYHKLDDLGINAPLIFVLFLVKSVSSYLFFAYRSVIISVNQKSYILHIVDFFITFATILIQIVVLLLTKDYMVFVTTGIVMVILQNGVNALIAHRMYPYAFKPEKESITKEERNGILKDCGALFIFKVSAVVLKATDSLVLSAFLGLAIIGKYSNYLIFYFTLKMFIANVYSGMFASMGNAYAKESVEKNYFIFEMVNFLTILLNGTACIGLAICSDDLIDVWIGEKYIIPQPFAFLLGIEILFSGLKINLGQVRNISGAFRQAWHRPLLGIAINVVVSIILCQYIGICGVIIGTITADILANFLIDPRIIHKYSFNGFKPVSYYYKKNLIFLTILGGVGVADFLICRQLATGYGLFDLLTHIMVCGISVPATFLLIYRKTEVCKYLVSKAMEAKWMSRFKK